MLTRSLVSRKLHRFLEDRKDRFPTVTEKQRQKWHDAIVSQIHETLDDNDIFYDNMPEDVEELGV